MHSKTIDINELTIKKYVESLRPEDPKTREQLDFGYTYDGKVVILYEIRPVWGTPDQKQHIEFAKMRFYKSRQQWNLYWMRASGKWELYEPYPEATNLDSIIEILKKDKYGCFFG